MITKTLSIAVLSGILISCSHAPKSVQFTTKSPLKKVSSWMAMLDSSSSSHRAPASAQTVTGLEEFIQAVKSHPEVFDLPVGKKVITKHGEMIDFMEEVKIEEAVYLKQNLHGYFVLKNDQGLKDSSLEAHDRDDVLSFENRIRNTQGLKEVKKLSENKYRLMISYSEYPQVLCGVEIDVMKSMELSEKACIDTKTGITLSYQKIISEKEVIMDTVAAELKSKQLTTFPMFLTCGQEGMPQDGYCSVTDEAEKDWSFLVTR